jgi:hypothetical protein
MSNSTPSLDSLGVLIAEIEVPSISKSWFTPPSLADTTGKRSNAQRASAKPLFMVIRGMTSFIKPHVIGSRNSHESNYTIERYVRSDAGSPLSILGCVSFVTCPYRMHGSG